MSDSDLKWLAGVELEDGSPNPNREADIVFVHGLGGHYHSTWHPEESKTDKEFFPSWLAKDFANVGVWSVDYEVEPNRWKGTTMPLVDRATNIVDLLDIYELGTRPIIFITHSMGGLVVKQMLRHAHDYGNDDWKNIVHHTKGIVYLSTPHAGSGLATFAKYLGGNAVTSVSVKELEAHNPSLRDLNEVYRNHEVLSKIPIRVYCENEPTFKVIVVDKDSANPGIPGATPIPLDKNHINIAKPESPKDRLYLGIKKFIRNCLKEEKLLPQFSAKAPLATQVTNIEDRNHFGNIDSNVSMNNNLGEKQTDTDFKKKD